MYKISLNDIMVGKDYPQAGQALFDVIEQHLNHDKIVIDLEGISALPSMFLNMSIGQYLKKYGAESLRKKITFTQVTKLQGERLRDYLEKYEKIQAEKA